MNVFDELVGDVSVVIALDPMSVLYVFFAIFLALLGALFIYSKL